MKALVRLFRSSLGQKYLMAISGLALVGFVCGHLVGNLQFFLPPEAINRYGHFLQSNLELLWPVRLTMLALVGLHLFSAVRLSAANRAARPDGYSGPVTAYGSSFASRTMLVSGLIIASFIVFHLLHYTVKVEGLNGTAIEFHRLKEANTGYHDIYAMMVAGFSVWYVSLFYIVGVTLLCLHLSHGVGAMLQSLGLRNPVYAPLVARGAKVLAAGLLLGYLSMPVAVLLGHGKDYLAKVVATNTQGMAAQTHGGEAAK
jgi:succinate dehydrogenase / fumarate reductase cytochrome b subunit